MSRIKELPKSTSHLLSCTQVITSVQSVVKELLENALDSHATSVEIKLENFGLEKIEVKDNGDGIIKDDIHFVAKPHCTSKITSHLDLVKINTYGFRGEALAAICAVADLVITTKTADEEYGYTYTFDHNGNILSTKPCPCNQGTSVVVANLFNNLPVRKQLYRPEKKKKDELRMIEDILIAFGCILTRIRFVLYHNRNLIWQKSVVDQTLDGLRLALGDAADYMENCEYVDEETQIKIETFLPKCNAPPTCGQTSSNRSIVAINNRPVRMKSIDKLLKEHYCKTFGDGHKSRYPICFISIEVPTTDIDVNYEPNKTAVLLHNMDIIKEQLSKLLRSFYYTESNVETDSHPKKDSNEIFPMPAEDKIKKASGIHDSSKIVDKEIGSPTFHLNRSHSHFLDGLQNNRPKENLVLSKKLSRKNDFHTPSNKKIKFSTPPNDVYRHISTLDAFFSSENKANEDNNTKSNDSCTNELHMEKSSKNGMNSENSCIRNKNITTDPNSMIDTVQRKIVGVNDDETLDLDALDNTFNKKTTETSVKDCSFFFGGSNLPNEVSNDTCSFNSTTSGRNQTESLRLNEINKDTFVSALSMITDCNVQRKIVGVNDDETLDLDALDKTLNKKTTETSVKDSSFFIGGSNLPNEVSKNSCSFNSTTSGSNQAGSLKLNDLNKDPLISALSMINKERNWELQSIETNKILTTFSEGPHEVQGSKSNLDSDPLTAGDWSRGLHPAENIQPVAVLKPKLAETKQTDASREEAGGNAEQIDLQEPCVVSMVQRKITPFDFFCRKHRLEVASLNPELNNQQIAQILSEKWNCLSSEEKAVYKNMVSKDYPKNIRKKEKLGKIVEENISKIKISSANSKKAVQKKRRKRRERNITFDMQLLRECDLNSSLEEKHGENFKAVNCLAPGIWICCQKNKLYLLNCYRLQEAVIYFRLLETYAFEAEQIESSIILTYSSLGNDALDVLLQMEVVNEYGSEYISDKKLTANGFKMRILRGNDEIQVELIGMTNSMAFYGVPDLKEILCLIKEKGFDAKLSDCRPGKAVLYLQGEAVRITRQSPALKQLEDIEDLLKQIDSLPVQTCFHSKPFLHELNIQYQ